MELKNNERRSEVLDIMKGLGIIFVVWGHSIGPYTNFITQFHMPLFFLISGFLFNSRKSLKKYIISKIHNLYIPFISWNILSIMISYAIGLNKYSLKVLTIEIIKISLTLSKDGQFFGATWFLGSLFIVSIIYKLLDTILIDGAFKKLLILTYFLVVAITGFNIQFPYDISRTMVLSLFFALGVFIKDNQCEFIKYDKQVFIVFLLPLTISIFMNNTVNLGFYYKYKTIFIFSAISASYIILLISRFIFKKTNKISKIFIYLGKNSMDIVIWHLLVFRIVILLQLIIENKTTKTLLDHYPVYNSSKGIWIIYLIVGIIFSIIIGRILRLSYLGKILKKIYVVK